MINLSISFVLISLFLGVYSDYWEHRENVIRKEKAAAVGGNISLTSQEKQVNKFLLKMKEQEFNENAFLPAENFLSTKTAIENTKIFQFIKKLPKGTLLHTHLFASVNIDYVIKNITYRNNVYVCQENDRLKLRFLLNGREGCQELRMLRNENKSYDEELKRNLTITRDKNKYETWKHFSNTFSMVYGMLTYKPVFEDYVYQALEEVYADNLIYAEFRGNLIQLYELNGHIYNEIDSLRIFNNVINKFTNEHPKFIGAKYIYTASRKASNEELIKAKELLHEAKQKFPNLIAGFDLIGFEDGGKPLKTFVDELRKIDKNIRYFFHAGETNWYGSESDENLYDAVLLGSSRISHALSLYRHPELLRLIKERSVAIEVSPIANQMLKYASDLRNHPASMYISIGLPVVVCNDDPSVWGATGISYDWYMVYMAMTRRDSGLEVLQELALNSIWYSSMNKYEKEKALQMFQKQWNAYLDENLAMVQVLSMFLRIQNRQ